MIYFSLIVIALKTAIHFMTALGVEFKYNSNKEQKPAGNGIKFIANMFFVVAYGYIIYYFLSLKPQ